MSAGLRGSDYQEDLRDRFRGAMRTTISGVAVITTDGPSGRSGITVSSMCSLSFEPPSVMACIHKNSRVLPVIQSNGVFVANVLSQDQSDLARIFSNRVVTDSDRFKHGKWKQAQSGAPALQSATASFDCRLVRSFEFGSHRILVGEVLEVLAPMKPPLIYTNGEFHASAEIRPNSDVSHSI